MRKLKILTSCIATVCAAICGLTFSACAPEGEGENKSGLYGTFTYQETLGLGDSQLRITHNSTQNAANRDVLYSTVFPLDGGCEGTNVSYNMDQRLKLNRDFTYKYDYTVLLSNPGEWGGSFARLAVSVTGTFDYRKSAGDNIYYVLLDDPTGGTQTIYAPHVTSTSIYNWSMHGQPDMITDYSLAKTVKDFKYDKFACARITVVNRAEKTLKDNVFYADLLDYVMRYGTY